MYIVGRQYAIGAFNYTKLRMEHMMSIVDCGQEYQIDTAPVQSGVNANIVYATGQLVSAGSMKGSTRAVHDTKCFFLNNFFA